MKNFSDLLENSFCDRFSGYRYMTTVGNAPFKTAYFINAAVNIPFSIIATLANALVIISIWRSRSLRTPANMLLIGLALSDLGVGLFVQPFFIAHLISFAKQGTANFTCISTAVCCFIQNGNCDQLGTVSVASPPSTLRRCCYDEEGPANSGCVLALEWNLRYFLGCLFPGIQVLLVRYRYCALFGYFHRGLRKNLSHRSFASKANRKQPSFSRS